MGRKGAEGWILVVEHGAERAGGLKDMVWSGGEWRGKGWGFESG